MSMPSMQEPPGNSIYRRILEFVWGPFFPEKKSRVDGDSYDFLSPSRDTQTCDFVAHPMGIRSIALTWEQLGCINLARASHLLGDLHSRITPSGDKDLSHDTILTETFCSVLRTIEPGIQARLTLGSHAWPTAGYIAPELLAPYVPGSDCPTPSERTDVFAFGSLCYEVFTGNPPFHLLSVKGTFQEIGKGNRPPPIGCLNSHEAIWKCIEGCWEQTPSARPDFYKIAGLLESFLDSQVDSRRAITTKDEKPAMIEEQDAANTTNLCVV